MENGRFPCKIALHLKEVCYKVSLCVLRYLLALAYLSVMEIDGQTERKAFAIPCVALSLHAERRNEQYSIGRGGSLTPPPLVDDDPPTGDCKVWSGG